MSGSSQPLAQLRSLPWKTGLSKKREKENSVRCSICLGSESEDSPFKSWPWACVECWGVLAVSSRAIPKEHFDSSQTQRSASKTVWCSFFLPANFENQP